MQRIFYSGKHWQPNSVSTTQVKLLLTPRPETHQLTLHSSQPLCLTVGQVVLLMFQTAKFISTQSLYLKAEINKILQMNFAHKPTGH